MLSAPRLAKTTLALTLAASWLQLIMKDLEADLRKVMAPNTGAALRESKRNVLKDFVHIAGPLGVTHFLILTATQNASYLRIAKTPRVRSSLPLEPQRDTFRLRAARMPQKTCSPSWGDSIIVGKQGHGLRQGYYC